MIRNIAHGTNKGSKNLQETKCQRATPVKQTVTHSISKNDLTCKQSLMQNKFDYNVVFLRSKRMVGIFFETWV